MGLDYVRQVFERLGREDPMYGVLTHTRYRGNRWNPEVFFRIVREAVAAVLRYAEERKSPSGRERALDFGCGVGRLTQALGDHFEEAIGVDISHTMIEAAEGYNRHGDRVRYVRNTTPNLARFEDGVFDFIYSNITLQHVPPESAIAYVGEFVRVLRPGGLAIFQMRNGPRVDPGTMRSLLYDFNRLHLRRSLQRLRRRPHYEMHYVARSQVEERVAASGGRILDVADMSRSRPNRSLRYCVTRPD